MPNSFWRFHDGNIFVLWILLYALGNVHKSLQIDCWITKPQEIPALRASFDT